ncbi:MAG: ABC transporter ATP-binding protein [Desulfobacterales bacterium]
MTKKYPGCCDTEMAETAHDAFLIRAKGLYKSFKSNAGQIEILRDLSLCLEEGESVAVVGASGIGKSTLLHILGTLDYPDRGNLYFRGRDVFRFSQEKLAGFRNRSIGFVFQFHHLLPEFSALENAMMPLLISGRDKESAAQCAEKILERVGLKNRISHRVTELSGGEQQRVALARALVIGPALLLADEPTGNLDKRNSAQIHGLLRELNTELKMTLVVVTHSAELAACMSRRVTLSDGQLTESL